MDLKMELQEGIENCGKLELGLCTRCIKTKEKSLEEGSGKSSLIGLFNIGTSLPISKDINK
jgi:hypothetical protein